MDSPRIRIEIADVLIQASNNGLIELDRREARAYSRQVAQGITADAKTTAILNLGLLGNPGDIQLLKEIALREDRQTFRAAVISPARMCGPDAEKALAEVRAKVTGADHRQFGVDSGEAGPAPRKRAPSYRHSSGKRQVPDGFRNPTDLRRFHRMDGSRGVHVSALCPCDDRERLSGAHDADVFVSAVAMSVASCV